MRRWNARGSRAGNYHISFVPPVPVIAPRNEAKSRAAAYQTLRHKAKIQNPVFLMPRIYTDCRTQQQPSGQLTLPANIGQLRV